MASSRASALLDSLLGRDQPLSLEPARRNLFRREGAPGRLAGEHSETPGRRKLAAALAVILIGASGLVLFGWLKLQRPVPIDERMSLASDGGTPGGRAAGGTGGPSATRGSPGGSSDGGSDGSTESTSGPNTGPEAGKDGVAAGAKIIVHVAGAVASPGIVTLSSHSRVVDAVTAAGGLRADADPDRLNLAEPLSDGVRVVVPALGQESLPPPLPLSGPGSGGVSGGGQSGAVGGSVGSGPTNLNNATAAELERLPGVGPATSAAIIAKREKDGPFSSVDSLLDVRGIGQAKLDALRDLVTVD